jgi:hypothetical protein
LTQQTQASDEYQEFHLPLAGAGRISWLVRISSVVSLGSPWPFNRTNTGLRRISGVSSPAGWSGMNQFADTNIQRFISRLPMAAATHNTESHTNIGSFISHLETRAASAG